MFVLLRYRQSYPARPVPNQKLHRPRRENHNVLTASAVIGAVTGRRSKWLVLSIWLLVGLACVPLAGKLTNVTVNDQKSSLPANADSAKVVDLQNRFPGADTLPALVVYSRAGGLTAQDKALVRADAAKLQALHLSGEQGVFPGPSSPDGRATFLTVPLKTANDLTRTIKDAQGISHAVGTGTGGLQIRVTGPAGLLADTANVFTNINATLLLASVLVVAVLLLITYRSPFLWLVPLISVGLFADVTSRALAYLLASRFGLRIDGQVAGITIVLVFGAGTDYALLLISRYREELRRHRDKHEAMATALRQAGPAILASGLTVSLALLTLLFAVLNSNRGLGPLAALGVFMAMVAMLTALPAFLLGVPPRHLLAAGATLRLGLRRGHRLLGALQPAPVRRPHHPAPPAGGRHHRDRHGASWPWASPSSTAT